MEADVEARKRKNVGRRYKTEAIQVNWEPEYCIHAAMCWRSLPAVFQPRSSPWINAAAAGADELARVVMMCPSGALSFERLDGGPPEPSPETATVDPTPDGPLYVRGRIRVEDGTGQVIRKAARVALCRCGHSENKPFCDMSHLTVGFRSG